MKTAAVTASMWIGAAAFACCALPLRGTAAPLAPPAPLTASATLAAPATNALIATPPLRRAAPDASVDILIKLPLRKRAELEALIASQTSVGSPLYHHFLTPAQFRAAYGPTEQSITTATRLLAARGLTVTGRTAQLLFVHGRVAAMERAFAVPLSVVRARSGRSAIATRGAIRLPQALAALGASVHGLYQAIAPESNLRAAPQSLYGPFGAYWFDDLKEAYAYPAYATANGGGVTIATVGYSDFNAADAAMYFANERLGATAGDLAPAPVLRHVLLPGGAAFDPLSRDSFEANLDVQQAAGSAPGATITNVVAPAGAGEGFLYAYAFLDEANFAAIVSTSYGGCELAYTAAYNAGLDLTGVLRAYHDLFLQGNAQGITFVFSSGDRGARECPPPAYYNRGPGLYLAAVPSVQYWADDPNVTAVGGTALATSYVPGSRRSTYAYEIAYANPLLPEDPAGTGNLLMHDVFGSGGGQSVIWPKPAYQQLVETGTVGRAVPDLAMQMGTCPRGAVQPCRPALSSTVEAFAGAFVGAVGTSIAAPEFAGLLAVAVQAQGGERLGNVNPLIYRLAHTGGTPGNPFYHQFIPGNNGLDNIAAVSSYDPITGVGTPIARSWLGLPLAPLAGDPQTPSNP